MTKANTFLRDLDSRYRSRFAPLAPSSSWLSAAGEPEKPAQECELVDKQLVASRFEYSAAEAVLMAIPQSPRDSSLCQNGGMALNKGLL